MGWKNVRDHYRIEHSVQVTSKGICIGSPYIHDLIVISLDGVVKKRDDGTCNEDLRRYMAEFEEFPDVLKHLVTTPDTFTKSIKVYTYDGGDIIEKECEILGWPNVTHDGEMMYANTFSDDRITLIDWAILDARAGVRISKDRVLRAKTELEISELQLKQCRANLRKLGKLRSTVE